MFTIPTELSREIFRAYDIRGIVGKMLNPDVIYALGRAIGSEILARGENQVVVGRDGRLSGPLLSRALIAGLLESGCFVTDLGAIPSPVMYFATHTTSSRSGVMLTGSHNPATYNGLKIVLSGETITEAGIQDLYRRIIENDLKTGRGQLEVNPPILDHYLETILNQVSLLRPLRVVVDCGSGIAGLVVPKLLRQLGCEVVELFCEVDGRFPHHHPDPSQPDNLRILQQTVLCENADVGLAFDGDGDRLGVITNHGEIIWPDRQLMLYAMDVLSRHPGATIIYDVKCTRHLGDLIRQHGGQPLMWKTGHSLIKSKMREVDALLAGEMSGHIFFKERWYGFDDAVYAAARLLEILSADDRDASTLFKTLPDSVNTPELKLEMEEHRKFNFMQDLLSKAHVFEGIAQTIDGLRIDFADGWGLIRPSNTTACLVLRFEADNEQALQRIQNDFRHHLLALDDGLVLPF